MISSNHDNRIGAFPLPDEDATFFRVWASKRRSVEVEVFRDENFLGRFPLTKEYQGFFSGTVPGIGPGDRYLFRLDEEQSRPDPASRFQPDGVHRASQVIDSANWKAADQLWKGIPRKDLIIYEIHVGTFTGEGTFAAVESRLDELIDLGVTALEIMPIAAAPGRWNWGYDGVYFFAPFAPYGTPEEFRSLIDTCHRRGLAVILDVVYNHIGPEGNYLAEFAPYFSRKHRTPWGDAFDYDGVQSGPVRDFILQNVAYWLEDFQLDGLRLDAIRLMFDDGPEPIVDEIASIVRDQRGKLGREIHLIGEANVYDSHLLESGYDAIWSDEVPHVIQSLVLDQNRVASREYRGADDLAECLDRGYLFEFRNRKIERRPSDPRGELTRIVHGLQTHDQVGNHPEGKRYSDLAGTEAQKAAAALVILYPGIPFIFMGEEFATPSPFCFFVDYGDESLRRAVVEGRKRDYDHHDWNDFVSPISEEAFLRSKLPASSGGNRDVLDWYRQLIQIRQKWQDTGVLNEEQLAVKQKGAWIVLNYGKAWVASRVAPSEEPQAGPDLEGRVILRSEGDRGEAIVGERF